MIARLIQLLVLAALLLGGGYGLFRYERWRSSEAVLKARIDQLERQKKHLQDFVSRLSRETRRAEIVVTDQVSKNGIVESTTLMFLESDGNGNRIPSPKFFTIKGEWAHVDALVVKFERGFIENDDRLRGHSIVLFYRLFGNHQTPADAFPIDDPDQPPAIYRPDGTIDAEAQEFEAAFWRDFWKLAGDPKAAAEKGIRVIQGESPWRPFYPNYIYELSLDAPGGLNIKVRPMDGLMRELQEALKRPRK